jgi:hypothetical protein
VDILPPVAEALKVQKAQQAAQRIKANGILLLRGRAKVSGLIWKGARWIEIRGS